MMEVIPAIIAKNFEELKEKIKKVEAFVSWVQIDVSDGIFTPNVTWNNPSDLKNLKSEVQLEIHLMINNPQKFIEGWTGSGVKKIIIHVDAKSDFEEIKSISKKIKNRGVQFGIALTPEVSVTDVENIIPIADVVLLLAVNPGFGGQEFQPKTLEKIKTLRELFPHATIEVDGGINLETTKQCVEVGADILVSGSFIFNSNNIEEAIQKLKGEMSP